jgi:hypothetical protein
LARLVVTMGMLALIYEWYFPAPVMREPERSVLKISGMARETRSGWSTRQAMPSYDVGLTA